MRQKPRIAGIIGVLDAIVLLNRQGVGEMHRVAFFDQTIDQPIPVVSGLDHNAADVISKRRQVLMDIGKIIV